MFPHRLLLVLLLLLAIAGKPVCQASTIIVSGTSPSSSLITSIANAYLYDRDDVSISYSSTTSSSTALSQYQLGLNQLVVTEALPQNTQALQQYGSSFIQLPLAANALVIAYNVHELSNLTQSLVLDITTLGRIWCGSITNWNNSAIAALNPTLATHLPNATIELVYQGTPDYMLADSTAAFFQALLNDSTFASAAKDVATNGSLSKILGGQGYTNDSFDGRLGLMINTPHSMGYLTLSQAAASSGTANFNRLRMASMSDASGITVEASSTSVAQAMSYWRATATAAQLLADISNGAQGSWPLSFLGPIALFYPNQTGTYNCPMVQNLMSVLAWTQMNVYAVQLAINLGYVGLDTSYVHAMVNGISTVTCDGLVQSTSYVIGMGPPLPVYTTWVAEYPGTLTLEYFTESSSEATQYTASGGVDFGSTVATLTAADIASMPDAEAIRMCAHAYAWTYNIPALATKEPLVFTWDLVSDIYLNKVKMWNDTQIKDLNPRVANLLPQSEIIVAYFNSSPTFVEYPLTALSRMVPEFNATVGATNSPTFPVVVEEPWRTIPVAGLGTMQELLIRTSNVFTIWFNYYVENIVILNFIQLPNSEGVYLWPNATTIEAAIQNYQGSPDDMFLMFSPGSMSYPMVSYDAVILRSKSMPNFTKAQALVNWIYWTQTNSLAAQIARASHVVLPTQFMTTMVDQLANVTSENMVAFSYAPCVYKGTICSNSGTCSSGECLCVPGRTGTYCQSNETTTTLPVGTIVGAVLGSALPVILMLVGLSTFCIVWAVAFRKRRQHHDWEIAIDELEMGEILGAGGYGEVYKAIWKGTEVAVKIISAEEQAVSRDVQKSFRDEVEVMTSLRHPNVVLFMAACTRPPKMCIVMEFMGLGSLYDLLHNELISEIPLPLKVRLALQAAKGMHFLHSSGIVHRDLKSLNLLLDNKWNLKVSDFGLTCFRGQLKKEAQNQQQGSVHWMAPEILSEDTEVDHILSDIYSFGIILWELLTRQHPYEGLTPAAVAVAVIRDDARPNMPIGEVDADYEKLITDCWHRDPTVRPTFLEVMTRLSSMIDEGGSSSSSSFFSSKMRQTGSGSGSGSGGGGGSSGTGSSSSMSAEEVGAAHGGINDHVGGVRPPEGEVALVFTDIAKAASLWSSCPRAMRDATLQHNQVLRSLLTKHRGYEAIFLKEKLVGEGSFCMVFGSTLDALAWCSEVQQSLLQVEWPEELLSQAGAGEEIGGAEDRLLFRGLRVRMGVHVGVPKLKRDPMSRRVEYVGPPVVAAAKVTVLAQGGQVLISASAFEKVRNTALAKDKHRFIRLGVVDLSDPTKEDPQRQTSSEIFEVKLAGLEARYFDNMGAMRADSSTHSSSLNSGAGKEKSSSTFVRSMGVVGSVRSEREPMNLEKLEAASGEDGFLTGANLVRWVIRFEDIQMGEQIGTGSYGIVYRGVWKGVDVAVKRFIKQKLDERHLLEFRAEVACLSELRHPNIVLFIGACLRMPNLCLITEWVKQGSLNSILASGSASSSAQVKLPWPLRMRMLRDAARGVHYLHSLEPPIVHRDLKSSNLLVDESFNVKVADFGFARIKEDNATMTRCGTPAWTAPEVIRGDRYSESADVYSFGIIMWEVLTRKVPYDGRNFMGVTLDVLEGKRPPVPGDCPKDYRTMMKSCWKAKMDKRPTMGQVVQFFLLAIGGQSGPDELI